MTLSANWPIARNDSVPSWRAHLLPVALLAFAWLIYAGPLLSTATVLYETDTFAQDVPLRIYSARWIRDGVLPTWTADLHCGYPIFADGQTGVLYPPYLLYILAPTPEMHDRFMALHYALAAIFAYLFLAGTLREPMAACVGAVTFMASAALQSMHVVPGVLASTCWLPLSLWLIDRYAQGKTKSIFALALVNAMSILAGVVQAALYSFALQALYFLFRVGGKNLARLAFGGFFAFLIPPLLASVQLLPTYYFSATSTRLETGGSSLGWEQFTTGHLDLRHLLTFIFPDLYGDPRHYSLPGDPYNVWAETLQVFMGFAAVVLLPIGTLAGRPKRDRFFWFAILVLAVLCATASPFYRLIYYLPVFNWFRWPSRYMVLFALAASTLTAMGAAWLIERSRGRAKSEASTFRLGVALILLAILGMHRTMGYFTTASDFYREASETILHEREVSDHFRLMPLARALYETWTMDDKQLRHNARFLPVSYNLLWNVPAAALFDQGNAVTPRSVHEIHSLQHPNALRISAITHVSSPVPPESLSDLERAIHGGYYPNPAQLEILAADDPFVARLRAARPRAWIVHDVIVVPDSQERLQTIGSDEFDPAKIAVVEEAVALAPATQAERVRVAEPRPDRLIVDAECTTEGLLVVADSYQAGWTVTIDGQPGEILRVNHAFRGVVLPMGRHHVVFQYRPPGLTWGLFISAASTMILIVSSLLTTRSHRRGRGNARN